MEIGCYAVGKVVSTGKAAMQWVKYCARVIVGKRKQPKQHEPLGLPQSEAGKEHYYLGNYILFDRFDIEKNIQNPACDG